MISLAVFERVNTPPVLDWTYTWRTATLEQNQTDSVHLESFSFEMQLGSQSHKCFIDKDTFDNVAVQSVTHKLDKSQYWRATRDGDVPSEHLPAENLVFSLFSLEHSDFH